jgi:hypothetical protein
MRVYADQAALTAYPGGSAVPTDTVAARLVTASAMVDQLLVQRAYDVDTDGMPTDADDIAALRDATCAIVVELNATGADTAGASVLWDSVGIGSVNLSGRRIAEGGTTALGLPVPAVALVLLRDVGTRWVTS